MARILIVEDDAALARGLVALLKGDGYAVDRVGDAEEALALERAEPYSLIILDVGLPRMSGFDALKALRARGSTTPVLILTARSERDDRVEGLDLGADDYLGKPFDGLELLARTRALIRRGVGNPAPTLRLGALVCDLAASAASVNDRPLNLRRREWAVLHALMSRAGRVVPKDRLVSEVFGYDDPVGTNAIEVYVTRVRQKLAPDGPSIRSLRGLGYMMDDT